MLKNKLAYMSVFNLFKSVNLENPRGSRAYPQKFWSYSKYDTRNDVHSGIQIKWFNLFRTSSTRATARPLPYCVRLYLGNSYLCMYIFSSVPLENLFWKLTWRSVICRNKPYLCRDLPPNCFYVGTSTKPPSLWWSFFWGNNFNFITFSRVGSKQRIKNQFLPIRDLPNSF